MSKYTWTEWANEAIRRGIESKELSLIWYYIEELQCFPPEVEGEHTVEVFDCTTGESIRVRSSCAFNATVMALKALSSNHTIRIVHKDWWSGQVFDRPVHDKYNEYTFNHTLGMVERTCSHSNMGVYGEREIA